MWLEEKLYAAAQNPAIRFAVSLAGVAARGDSLLLQQNGDILRAQGAPDSAANAYVDALREIFQLQRGYPVEYLRSQQDSLMRVLLAGNRTQLLPKPVQQNLQIILTTPLSTWMRFYTQFDPKPYIQATRCPVLALNGTLDRQVDAETNLGLIQEYTAQGGNRQVTVKACEGLNHLFQHATTGAPNEYPYIAETFSPAALELITQWILQQPSLTEP